MKKAIYFLATLFVTASLSACKKQVDAAEQSKQADLKLMAAGGPPQSGTSITNLYPASGIAGTTVNILGTGFSGNPSPFVQFPNYTSFAALGSFSSTQIQATAPTGGTSGAIRVASQSSMSPYVSSPFAYTYTTAAPKWKLLFLIVDTMDFTYTEIGSNINRHVVGSISASEKTLAENQFNTFVNTDVPALSSGMQAPVGTIRHISRLQHTWTSTENNSSNNNNLFPRQNFLGVNDDASFDGIILVFPATGSDINNGNANITFSPYGGQTPNNGSGRTYATFSTNRLSSTDRNVYIHEFGHSITFYYFAVSPSCLGSFTNSGNIHTFNHTGGTGERTYVRFQDKNGYVFSDNITVNNSLYKNDYSFSHDYYSGFTTDNRAKNVAIGIGQAQWNLGGPVTH